MPNEIYHRSNFGNPNAEGFGDAYYDHAATNKLYNHSDYYENSDGTDATLKDLNNKASIVLTPTAYSDGSLNTVIPPYGFGSELIVNGDFASGTSPFEAYQCTLSNVNNTLVATATSANDSRVKQVMTTVSGKKYKITADLLSLSGSKVGVTNRNGNSFTYSGDVDERTTSGEFVLFFTAESTQTTVVFKMFDASIGESFSIDNVSVKEIQEADFDFSRGSSATRVNEQGLVEDVQILSGELVQNGDFEQIGSEFITNGYFSDGTTGWVKGTAPSATQEVVNGALVMYAGSNADANNALSRTDTPQGYNGKIYKLELNRSDFVNGTLGYLRLDGVYDPSNIISFGAGTSDIYFTAYRDFTHVRFFAGSAEAGYTIDNVSLKEVGQNWTFGTGWSIEDGVVSANAPSGNLDQSLSATSGSKYRVTFTISNYVSGDIRWRFTGTSNENGTLRSANGTYTEEITLTNNQSIFRFPATSGVMDIDNVSIVEVTDDTDLPRIDFTDGTGSLLLEPSSTNLLTYSEDFTQWDKNSGTTITSNSVISPDGTQNATKVVSAGTGSRVGLNTSIVSGTTYTLSVYLKNNGGNTSVSIGSHGTTQLETVTINNEWNRYTTTFVASSTTTSSIRINSSGSNINLYAWGAMLETKGYATSYIPTSGSTVTRSADLANNSGNADLFNDSEGVLYAEIAALANDSTYRLISISDGTGSNRIYIGFRNNSNMITSIIDDGGSTQATFNYTVTDTKSYHKVAIKYKENDVQFYIDGQQVGTDTSATIPSGLNSLQFTSGALSSKFYGKVRNVAVFKEALSNDLLERLTGEGYESFRLLAEANNYTII